MRYLHADLEVCKKVIDGKWHTDSEGVSVFSDMDFMGEVTICDCYHLCTANFIAESREGWPEAINRAIAAESEVEGLQELISGLEFCVYNGGQANNGYQESYECPYCHGSKQDGHFEDCKISQIIKR